MKTTRPLASALALLAVLGCPSSSGNDAGDVADAEADGAADVEDVPDAPDADATDGDDGDASTGDPPVAPETDPEPLAVSDWMFGIVDSAAGDPLEAPIAAETFEYPAAGNDPRGVFWRAVTPGTNGTIGSASRSLAYGVARLSFDEPTRIIARVDRAWEVYLNGAPQPGDVYGTRRMRVPMVARAGENLLVVRGVPAYGAMEVELFTTPDEIAFNLQDTTPPEGVTGETDEMWLGVPALHLTGEWIGPVHARVVEDDRFEASEETIPGLSAASLTQIPFRLVPKIAMPAAGGTVPVRIRVVCADLDWSYEREVEIGVVAPDVARRKTFIDPTDDSVQYYGLLPPASFDAGRDYALVLSLHGAGVDAIGQARSYSARDWNYVVAATNRRPFGFDWEEWGRLNALAALDDAQASLRIDPTRVYLTGHSMGGHGTWHVGVTTPGRFATIGPSAGWESFYSYGGSSRPSGTIGRARAHSDTLVYLENLARRGVYIIHGDADDNVPVSEGRNLYAAVQAVTDDVVYHEEPGAGHWWDGDAAPGADCVDWPPLFDFMQARTLDPVELEFTFRSPSPAYSPRHSFVTLESAITPMEDLVVSSAPVDEETVEVTTTNVRSLSIDGAALRGRGVVTAVIDGETHAVPDGVLRIGPATGKTHDVNGPYNQVFHRAFCFVHPDEPGPAARAAAYLTSYWQIYGNGHACSVPISRVDAALRGERNLIYVGLSAEQIGRSDLPVTWTDDAVFVGGDRFWRSGMLFVFPEGDRLSAAIVATTGDPHNFYAIVPFSSRSGYPDYLVWTGSRLAATGFFDADWAYDPALREP